MPQIGLCFLLLLRNFIKTISVLFTRKEIYLLYYYYTIIIYLLYY